MSQEWHVHKDGQTLGPYTWEELQQQAESGEINKADMVWKEGMSDWSRADQVQDLLPEDPVPPPPPPPPSPPADDRQSQSPPPPPPAAGSAAHTSARSASPTHRTQRQPREEVMSVGSWLGTLILLYIPLLNILLLLIWAFSSTTNRNKQNFSRATLLLGVLVGILTVIGYAVFLAGSNIL
ncbi:MAG: DUF4339 domain-containing protein [Anaerolineales bacterium]